MRLDDGETLETILPWPDRLSRLPKEIIAHLEAFVFSLSRKRRSRYGDASAAGSAAPELDPKAVKGALNQAIKTLTNPEYQEQLSKLTQEAILNSVQTFQSLGLLSGRLSKLDDKSMAEIVEGSIDDLTRAFLQYNSEQLVLLQRLSARTLEILDKESRGKRERA